MATRSQPVEPEKPIPAGLVTGIRRRGALRSQPLDDRSDPAQTKLIEALGNVGLCVMSVFRTYVRCHTVGEHAQQNTGAVAGLEDRGLADTHGDVALKCLQPQLRAA